MTAAAPTTEAMASQGIPSTADAFSTDSATPDGLITTESYSTNDDIMITTESYNTNDDMTKASMIVIKKIDLYHVYCHWLTSYKISE